MQMDPRKWKLKYYAIPIRCLSSADSTGANSVLIDTRPFYCDMITHAIQGGKKDWQYGDYNLLIRDAETSYQNVPANAAAMFGDVFTGRAIPLRQPILWRGGQTVSVEMQNLYDRTVEFAGYFTVQVILHGMECIDAETAQLIAAGKF
jgi:hypothetical protein